MDVYCSSCGEPWDVYHLQHDEIFDIDLCEADIEAWLHLSPTAQLEGRYRDLFRAAGWEFGRTVLNVIRCPACPKDATPNEEQVAIKAVLEDMLADDPDALAATFEDHHL